MPLLGLLGLVGSQRRTACTQKTLFSLGKREEVGRLEKYISLACNRWDYKTDLAAVGSVLGCMGWADQRLHVYREQVSRPNVNSRGTLVY